MLIIILKDKTLFGEDGTVFQTLQHNILQKSSFKNIRNFSQKQLIHRKRYLLEIEALAKDFFRDIFQSEIIIVTNIRNIHNIVKKDRFLSPYQKKCIYRDVEDNELLLSREKSV